METWPGRARPLGAQLDADGTNFALFSEGATAVTLCLFDADGTETRLPLTEVDGFVWHCYVPGVGRGQRYGFRVDGPWDPANGLRFNAAKLLLDPYAKGIDGAVDWGQEVFGHQLGSPWPAMMMIPQPTPTAAWWWSARSTGSSPTGARSCARIFRTMSPSSTRRM